MQPSLRRTLLTAVVVAGTACSSDKPSPQAATELTSDSAGGLVVAPSEPYRPGGTASQSALMVTLGGDSSKVPATPNCAGKEGTPASTVFWVDGLREGKALPVERKYDLVSTACGLEPRMQATVVGGAVNVFNDLNAVHRLVFIRAGTTDTLQTMPFTNLKAIVATDRLTRIPGIVEVRCAQHAGEKAYLAVFDHPYFGVAATGETVKLESIPAGDYKVMTWREGLAAPLAVPAKINATGQTEVVLR